jgi:citrate lyase beta subunit
MPSHGAGYETKRVIARSILFFPGDRTDRMAKAGATEADVVILDLEDAVASKSQAAARLEIARFLEAYRQSL